MRYALPGSALVHAAALGAGLLLVAWPDAGDAPAAQAVSVEVIAIASVSANQSATIQSDASETLVSSGAKAVPLTTPETLEAMKPETVQPVETAIEPIAEAETAVQTPAPVVAPVEPVDIAEAEPQRMDVSVLSAISPQTLETETVAPVVPNATAAPTPHVLTRPRPSEPTQRPRPVAPKQPEQQRAQPRPSAPAGNGGRNQADSVAAKPSADQQGSSGSGGDADVARYPSQVLSKLRRALRYPRAAGGVSGEVHVQFTVSAGGQPSGVRVVKSSGSAAIDQAGLDTVMRAAPFPPIPPAAQRNSWGFTIPLAFVRG